MGVSNGNTSIGVAYSCSGIAVFGILDVIANITSKSSTDGLNQKITQPCQISLLIHKPMDVLSVAAAYFYLSPSYQYF